MLDNCLFLPCARDLRSSCTGHLLVSDFFLLPGTGRHRTGQTGDIAAGAVSNGLLIAGNGLPVLVAEIDLVNSGTGKSGAGEGIETLCSAWCRVAVVVALVNVLAGVWNGGATSRLPFC